MKVVLGDKTVLPFTLIWLAIVMNLSFVIKPNLASFAFPYYHGQFYGFADAARLAAIAFFMQRRWVLVACCLSFGFTIHPIKATMAAIFMAGAIAIDWRSLSWVSVFWGMVSLVAFAAWAYFFLGIGQYGGRELVHLEQFAQYTRIFQFHWYPIDRGYFGLHYHVGLAPFLGLMGVMFFGIITD